MHTIVFPNAGRFRTNGQKRQVRFLIRPYIYQLLQMAVSAEPNASPPSLKAEVQIPLSALCLPDAAKLVTASTASAQELGSGGVPSFPCVQTLFWLYPQ
jgi:hypothetical protein